MGQPYPANFVDPTSPCPLPTMPALNWAPKRAQCRLFLIQDSRRITYRRPSLRYPVAPTYHVATGCSILVSQGRLRMKGASDIVLARCFVVERSIEPAGRELNLVARYEDCCRFESSAKVGFGSSGSRELVQKVTKLGNGRVGIGPEQGQPLVDQFGQSQASNVHNSFFCGLRRDGN
jgi:hypothetical protein